MNDAWVELTDAEHGDASSRLAHRLSTGEPTPSPVYYLDLETFWNDGMSDAGSLISLSDLVRDDFCYCKMLRALQQCLAPDAFLYALDWQHTCYRFWPHRLPADAPASEWAVPLLPDGDYYHFLSEYFQVGLLGYRYGMSGSADDEPAWCIFGAPLLEAVVSSLPVVVDRIVWENRDDG